LGWRQANPLAPLNLISDQALRQPISEEQNRQAIHLSCIDRCSNKPRHF